MLKAAVKRRTLCEAILNTPVAGDFPGLNCIIGASNPSFFRWFVPVFRDFGAGWLNRPQFICAARHEHTFFSVPLPVKSKSGVRHFVSRCAELCIFPTLAAIR